MHSSKKTRLFGTHGIRGIVGKSITPELALGLGRALGTYEGKAKRVLIGHDTRTSSELLEHAFISGVLDSGCNVTKLGMIPLPTLAFALRNIRSDAGVMITASHNPPEFNGIKFYDADGSAFTSHRDSAIEDLYCQQQFTVADYANKGKLDEDREVLEHYLASIVDRVDGRSIRERNLKIVVDAGGGAASHVTPSLLERLSCTVVKSNCEPDGLFRGRPLEPRPENLSKLQSLVKQHGADVGVAHDGDADRTAYVDENGNFIQGDRILALLCYYVLKDRPGNTIVTPLITSSVTDDAASLVKATVVRTAVGEPAVVEKMKETNALIGGEENVGLILRDWSWAREGPFAVALVLEIMAKMKQSISALLGMFPLYEMKKLDIPFVAEGDYEGQKHKVMQAIERNLPKHCLDVETVDGFKILFDDGWLSIRPSGTEFKFRVFAEARRQQRVEELASLGEQLVQQSLRQAS
jgi:phosphomannomutase/phosphoglucomutase